MTTNFGGHMVPGPEKRLPGQSNAEYGGRPDPNAEYLVTQSLHSSWELSWVMRAVRAVFRWFGRHWRPR
jgi:hypothetical protein